MLLHLVLWEEAHMRGMYSVEHSFYHFLSFAVIIVEKALWTCSSPGFLELQVGRTQSEREILNSAMT